MRGGKRKGAGRKPGGPRKMAYATKLPKWLVEWLKTQKNQSRLIEQVLTTYAKEINMISIEIRQGKYEAPTFIVSAREANALAASVNEILTEMIERQKKIWECEGTELPTLTTKERRLEKALDIVGNETTAAMLREDAAATKRIMDYMKADNHRIMGYQIWIQNANHIHVSAYKEIRQKVREAVEEYHENIQPK